MYLIYSKFSGFFCYKLFIFRGRKPADDDDDDASVDFDGEDSGSDYDENEKLLLEKTRKELASGPYDSDEESEVINFIYDFVNIYKKKYLFCL
jgi:hypothetical protein